MIYPNNIWKIQYRIGHERYEVILMRRSYAASVLQSLKRRGVQDIMILGPKEEIEAIYGVDGDTGS